MATPSTILIAILTFLSLAAHGAQQWLGNTGLTNDTPRIAYDKINTNFANLWAEVYTNLPAQIGSGGGGGGATNAVTKVNDLTNALQYFQIRTNAASAPTVNTNGFASKGTNFFDFPYAGNAVHGIMNSNDWQKIPPLQNANQGYVANTNLGNFAVISGGATNRNEGPWNVIAGGRNNRILGSDATNAVAVIGGGEDNQMLVGNNKHAVIGGGQSNTVINARYGGILSGWINQIGTSANVLASNACIAGGWHHTNSSFDSFIGGGRHNLILYTNGLTDALANQGNVIPGGWDNVIIGGQGAAILSGYNNRVQSGLGAPSVIAAQGTIVSGTDNVLGGSGGGNVTMGGSQNVNYGQFTFIGAGIVNSVAEAAIYGGILGGTGNQITAGQYATIIGGNGNTASADGVFMTGSSMSGSVGNEIHNGFSDATKNVQDGNGLRVLGSLSVAVASKTTTYTATLADNIILCDASGGAFAVTLPAANGRKGILLHVRKTDSSGNAVTVQRAGSDTIEGATSVGLPLQNSWTTLYSDGSATWYSYSRGLGYLSFQSGSLILSNAVAAGSIQTGSSVLSNIVTQGSAQTGSAILSNAVAAGVILTNTYTSSTSGTAVTNGIQNGRANFKNITGSGSVTITDQGTNIVIGSAAGGGNVVGPPSSTAFTLAPFADASGALLTNSLIATDSSRTNLFTPGYDRAYRVQGTNGIESLGWLHVAQKFTNDNSAFFGDTLNVAATATFANDILVTLASAFSSDLTIGGSAIHTGPVKYTMAAISASDLDWALSSARSKTLSANTTFTFSNLADDRHVFVYLTQDATGTRTVTWPTATWLQHTNQSGTLTAGGINTNANFVTVFHFWRVAGTVYGEVASTAPSRFDVEWSNGTVPSADIISRLSDETGTDKLVFSANSELSGTTRAAGLIATNLSQFGSINVTTQANVGGLTITNLGTAGSFNVTTQLNAGAVTVTNTLRGLGTGDNYISKLLATNDLRVQVGGNTAASNAWVGGTFYIDNSSYKNAGGDAVLTNASSVVVKALMLTNLYDAVEIWTSGAAQSSTATTNEIKVIYGSETILDTGLQGSSNTTWRVQTMITRTADKSQVCQASLWWGGNTFQLTNVNVGLSQTNGVDTTFKVQLASRKAGSFTNDFLHAKYLPAPH